MLIYNVYPWPIRNQRLRRSRDYLIHRLPVGLELLGIWIRIRGS